MIDEIERRIDQLSRAIINHEVSGKEETSEIERMRGALDECWRLRSIISRSKFSNQVSEHRERFDPGYRGHE